MDNPTFASELRDLIIRYREREAMDYVDILKDLDEWRSHVERWTRAQADKVANYLNERN